MLLWDVLWASAGLALAGAAFAVRVGINAGRTPGGVDTWYYLAYADAVRADPSLDVRLPQYLLQDERQSYPPLFPSLLALLPKAFLRRFYWTIAPAFDCAHLLLLYVLTYRLTESRVVSFLTGCVFGFTPQLVSETRNLNGRSFGILLHSLAMLAAIRAAMGGELWPWPAGAVAIGVALLLASATSSVAYGVVCLVLSAVFANASYAAYPCAALALTLLVTRGRFVRVIRNYVEAVDYGRRNRQFFGAHPILDSPLYASPGRSGRIARLPGFLGRDVPQHLLRLLGENPFLLALPLAPYGEFPWGPRLYWWAITLSALSVLATLVPGLRAFGPGRTWMKAAVFPTAYTLAAGIGSLSGIARPLGVATVAAMLLSLGSIGFYYFYMRRRTTQQTAALPPGLAEAAERLRSLPDPGGVFCLPTVYADYVAYRSQRPILWGGHCGDLRRFEELVPVVRRPLPALFRHYDVRFVLVDLEYVSPEQMRLGDQLQRVGGWARFALFEWTASRGERSPGPPQR